MIHQASFTHATSRTGAVTGNAVKDDDHVLPYDCDPSYEVDINNREIPE